MTTPSYNKGSCNVCETRLEYPSEMEGGEIQCPTCQQTTLLLSESASSTETKAAANPAPAWDAMTLRAGFVGNIPPTRVSLLYQVGLLIVTATMVILPLIYLGLIVAVAWATSYSATHFNPMALGGGSVRLRFFLIIVYITPIFAGVVLVLFMVKPFFARRGPAAQPLALNPGAEPALFSFVTRLCESIGAPFPTRIDVDCQLNASASFRRGMLSFLGSDLVLTIGAPLVAGLTLQQFAGVLAHEFGHFTQGFGMRLTYVIRRINGWFARVVYERDSWDMVLEEWAADSDYRVALMVGIARLGVWLSRLVLRALMLAGHGIGCFMLRQMEYDADSYQIKVAGSACFESAMRRINILGASMEGAYKHVRTTWNMSKALPDDLAFFLVKHDAHLPAERRTELEDTLGLQTTGLWDTHPSSGDRIRKARQSGEPGIFHLVAPASVLFGNFEAISKQVTLLHYQDDLQLPLLIAKLRPSDSFKL